MRKIAHPSPAPATPSAPPVVLTGTVSGVCGAPPGGCGGGRRRRVTVEADRWGHASCPSCGSELIRVRPSPGPVQVDEAALRVEFDTTDDRTTVARELPVYLDVRWGDRRRLANGRSWAPLTRREPTSEVAIAPLDTTPR